MVGAWPYARALLLLICRIICEVLQSINDFIEIVHGVLDTAQSFVEVYRGRLAYLYCQLHKGVANLPDE